MKKVKLIVAGPRDFYDHQEICEAIEKGIKKLKIEVVELVSGGANGTDKSGEQWAKSKNIPVKVFPAKWDVMTKDCRRKSRFDKWKKCDVEYNADAGFIRNEEMAKYADALIAIDLNTPGTKDMVSRAKDHGLLVYEHKICGSYKF